MSTRVEKRAQEADTRKTWGTHFPLAVLLTLAAFLGFSLSTAAAPQATTAPVPAPAIAAAHEVVPGVKNFGRVTPQLYRGAQPTAEGFSQLQKMGVSIIVDLRNEKGEIDRERAAVASRQMEFVTFPWNPWKDPTTAQVKEFFEVLAANPDKKIFLHCHKGADRTGTMVALYRIAAQHWTPQDALREMKTYHLHAFWFPHLERYVEKFPQLLEADPTLRSAPAAAPSSP